MFRSAHETIRGRKVRWLSSADRIDGITQGSSPPLLAMAFSASLLVFDDDVTSHRSSYRVDHHENASYEPPVTDQTLQSIFLVLSRRGTRRLAGFAVDP